MRDYVRQTMITLSVYLKRGQDALGKLEEGLIDDALAILGRRKAAFHNFLAVEALALRSGQNVYQNSAIIDLWQEIKDLEPRLLDALKSLHHQTVVEFRKVRAARQKIGKYRSARSAASQFENIA